MSLNLNHQVVTNIKEMAGQYNLDANDLLTQALKNYRRKLEEAKIKTEKQHFLRQHSQLKTLYLGMYIAMHQGQIVDYDAHFESLHRRIRQTYGRTAILIREVKPDPDPPLMLRSPRVRWSKPS